MDNGRRDRGDSIVWDFDWSDCAGASSYHLHVIGGNAAFPVINDQNVSASAYHFASQGAYIIENNRYNWTWKVRALIGGNWTAWSDSRTFDVEAIDTD